MKDKRQREKGAVKTQSENTAVWLGMDQKALDDAYDQNKFAPNRAQIVERRKINSELTRKIIGPPLRFEYGVSEIEWLDVFRTNQADAPINIFIHAI